MIIRNDGDVPVFEVEDEGAREVSGQILIGPVESSGNIIMRRFRIRPGGHTPHHLHDHEHVVKVIAGRGRITDGQGREHEIRAGQSVFVPGGEKHQFLNPGEDPFEFLCIILNPDRG